MTKQKSRGPETDRWCRHAQSPENGMWLPTGGQIGNGHIRISSLAHGEQRKKEKKSSDVCHQLPVKNDG